jgi:hypothetical protein
MFQQKVHSALAAYSGGTGAYWRVIAYQQEYARMQKDAGNFDDAEATLQEAYRLADRDQRLGVAEQFVELYVAWTRPENAAQWRATAAELVPTTAPTTGPATPATQPAR